MDDHDGEESIRFIITTNCLIKDNINDINDIMYSNEKILCVGVHGPHVAISHIHINNLINVIFGFKKKEQENKRENQQDRVTLTMRSRPFFFFYLMMI